MAQGAFKMLAAVTVRTLHSAPDTRSATIEAGEAFTVPEYEVGSGALKVFYNGLLCNAGEDAASATYTEVGDAGSMSTQIKFLSEVYASDDILIKVN